MMLLEKIYEQSDELAQNVINAWGEAVNAGLSKDLTPAFKTLFETTCRYRDAKRLADNHREFNVLSKEESLNEEETRADFTQACSEFHKTQEKVI